MKKKIIHLFLYACKYSGLFFLCSKITGNLLRILCYHNFSTGDELHWQPGMFMHPSTFQRRMEYLKNNGFSIIPLSQAIKQNNIRRWPKKSVVITIDDGWYSNLQFAHPILHNFAYPYTIYVTSYYSEKQTPIFNLVIPYIFWKSKKKSLNLKLDNVPVSGKINLADKPQVQDIVRKIVHYGQTQLDNEERYALAERLSILLNVDFATIRQRRILTLLSKKEITLLNQKGVDIQLHTHTHKFPEKEQLALQELSINRSYLKPLTTTPLEHFCYPCGIWSTNHYQALSTAEICSATTCKRGLNDRKNNPYTLKRFLDSENISMIEFEAELSGFLELFRKCFPKFPGFRA